LNQIQHEKRVAKEPVRSAPKHEEN